MSAPLYTTEVLRLAASLEAPMKLHRVDGQAERRSLTCGSRVVTEVQLNGAGHVEAISQEVQACAFGQAAASIASRQAVGLTGEQVELSLVELEAWLTGKGNLPLKLQDAAALQPARYRPARHGAILLPFQALSAAIQDASR